MVERLASCIRGTHCPRRNILTGGHAEPIQSMRRRRRRRRTTAHCCPSRPASQGPWAPGHRGSRPPDNVRRHPDRMTGIFRRFLSSIIGSPRGSFSRARHHGSLFSAPVQDDAGSSTCHLRQLLTMLAVEVSLSLLEVCMPMH